MSSIELWTLIIIIQFLIFTAERRPPLLSLDNICPPSRWSSTVPGRIMRMPFMNLVHLSSDNQTLWSVYCNLSWAMLPMTSEIYFCFLIHVFCFLSASVIPTIDLAMVWVCLLTDFMVRVTHFLLEADKALLHIWLLQHLIHVFWVMLIYKPLFNLLEETKDLYEAFSIHTLVVKTLISAQNFPWLLASNHLQVDFDQTTLWVILQGF